MSITHVASVTTGMVPSSVAVGDQVFLVGTVAEDGIGTFTYLAGWTPLSAITPGSTLYLSGSIYYTQHWVSGVWTKQWTGSGPTIYFPKVDDAASVAVSVWRGGFGLRDVAALVVDHGSTPGPVVAPGATAGVGDVALVAFLAAASITATTPATTSRAAARSLYVGSDVVATAGTTLAYAGNATSAAYTAVVGSLCLAIAPLQPTLGSPAPSAVQDLAAGPTFTWAHNRAGYAGSASGAQESYALRRRVGVGAYQYWNAGTASWSSTIVWNASVVQAVTFPAAAWTNETVYGWSVATTEDAGHNAGPFAPDRVLTARTKPVVSLSAPVAVVTTPQPPIVWSTSFTSPWAPIAYEVKIFTYAMAVLTGFDPDTATPVWTSGQYASTATTVTPWVGLSNAVEYRVFVRVQQTGAQWSDWDYVDFLVSLAAPATPAVTATPGTDPASGCPLVEVTVQARDNLLTAVDASFESGTGSWMVGVGTTMDTTTAWATDGTHALALTATSMYFGVAATQDNTGQTVSPGEVLTGTATFFSPVTARTVTVALEWFDSAGASLGLSASAGVLDSTSIDTVVAVTAAAPTGAATVALSVNGSLAHTETLYVDKAGIAPGPGTPWSPGGYIDDTVLVEFSDDPLGGTWGELAAGVTLGRSVTVTDWRAQPGQIRCYRARTSSGIYSSPPSTVAIAMIDVADFWLVDATAGTAIALHAVNDADRTRVTDRGVFEPLGRPARVVVTGTSRNQAGGMTARGWTEADTDALAAMLATGRVLLLQQSHEDGVYPRHLFTSVTSDVKVSREIQGPWPMRLLSWSWTQDDAPAGEAPGVVLPSLGVGVWS